MWEEPRLCPFRAIPDADPAPVAVKCAEAFVARNGYTLAPPAWGSAQLAEESFESGIFWQDILQRRRNSLEPKAAWVCAEASDRPDMAYTVVFHYRDRRVTAVARMVTMDREFSGLRMQQQPVRLSALTDPDLGCRPVSPRGGESGRDP